MGDRKISKATYLFFAVSLIVLASFGVYYAVFGAIIILVSGIAGAFKNQNPSNAILAFFAILAVIFGVLINVGPNIINNYVNGRNQEVAIRHPAESEIYGLKMMQLILPVNGHRLKKLSETRQKYTSTTPLINENNSSTLGLFGTAGFLVTGLLLIVILAGAKVDSRLNLLTLLVIVLFLFGTIGGLGAFFSWFISPLIRGWNRISIFIGFGAIATFFLVAQLFIEKYFPSTKKKPTILFVALTVLSVGLYDQTKWACQSCQERTKVAFEMEREFIQKIEQSLPQGSAIYQLPYMPFPEASHLNRLASYHLSAGFLHSKSLKWSYAGMRGRSGDFFYRSLSNEPIEEQLEIIKKLGFAGIYIDRRGYEDNANAIIDEFSLLIAKPTFIRSDGEIVFFPVKTEVTPANLESLTPEQIMENVDYFVDILGNGQRGN